MNIIHKYDFDPTTNGIVTIRLPKGAEILSVGTLYGKPQPYVWALHEIDAKKVDRKFRVYGTGHPIPEDNLKFIGTIQVHNGDIVHHLFEVL